MKATIDKLKLLVDVKTLVIIITFVFWLWVTRSNLSNTQKNIESTQSQIMAKIDDLAEWQKELIVTRDLQHSQIDKKLAYMEPLIQMIIKKIWL